MAQITLRYSRQELQKAFERSGVLNVDFEDKDNFAGYVNALITFLDQQESFDLNETTVVSSRRDASALRITLAAGCSYPDRFLGSIKTLQEFMFLASN